MWRQKEKECWKWILDADVMLVKLMKLISWSKRQDKTSPMLYKIQPSSYLLSYLILSFLLSLMKEWKRCDDKQGYRTCFTKYNQGNDNDVGWWSKQTFSRIDDDDVEVLRIDLKMVERSGRIQSKTDIQPNWGCILNSFY